MSTEVRLLYKFHLYGHHLLPAKVDYRFAIDVHSSYNGDVFYTAYLLDKPPDTKLVF